MSQSNISGRARQGGIPEGRLWHCPVDFDPAKCLPPKLRKYEQEVIYLLGLIRWQQAMRFGRLAKAKLACGVRLKAAYLREVMGKRVYKRIMQACIATITFPV
jgi:hypothetical protein